MKMHVSLIIPTHNRAGSLSHAINSALTQDYDSGAYEVVVVDNASTDHTAEVVREIQGANSGRALLYVFEGQLGLDNARHAGARTATGDVLVFTDDDATFDPHWLSAYVDAFATHAEMAGAGGPVLPVWEVPPPPWLTLLMNDQKKVGYLSLMDLGERFSLFPDNEFYGVNMAVRREALFQVGGFNPESFGDKWLGDGESGLVIKLKDRGWSIGYVPGAVVRHHIPPGRLTMSYLRKRYANEGGASAYTFFKSRGMAAPVVMKYVTRIAVKYWVFWLVLPLVKDRTSAWAIDLQLRGAITWSRVTYAMRLLFDKELRRLVEHGNRLEAPEI
jgi:glycosyltransferase involved in cell wall biosynthesis